MEIRNRYTIYKHSSLNIFKRDGYPYDDYKLIHDSGKFEATICYRKQTNYANGNVYHKWIINEINCEDEAIVNYINEFIEYLYDQIIYPKIKKIKIQDTAIIYYNTSEYQEELINALKDSFASEVKIENPNSDDDLFNPNIILKVTIV